MVNVSLNLKNIYGLKKDMSIVNKVVRAGVIPAIKIGDSQIWRYMFMKPSDATYGGDKFQIAKGRIEINESNVDAALREANEELGLKLENINCVKYLGKFLGRTHIYVATVKDQYDFGKTTFETGNTIWLSSFEYDLIGRDIHKPIIAKLDKFCDENFQDNLSKCSDNVDIKVPTSEMT